MQQLELELPVVKPVEQLQEDDNLEKLKMLKAHYQRIYRYATNKGRKILRYQIRKLNNQILGL